MAAIRACGKSTTMWAYSSYCLYQAHRPLFSWGCFSFSSRDGGPTAQGAGNCSIECFSKYPLTGMASSPIPATFEVGLLPWAQVWPKPCSTPLNGVLVNVWKKRKLKSEMCLYFIESLHLHHSWKNARATPSTRRWCSERYWYMWCGEGTTWSLLCMIRLAEM